MSETRATDSAQVRDGAFVPRARRAPVAAPRPGTLRPGDPGGEGDALTRTIRRWAKPTSVEELQRRGVKNVRSVSMSKVAALIEKAVNRALIERTLVSGTDTNEALALSSSARDEFLRLTKGELGAGGDGGPGPFADERLRDRATSTLDRLKRELVQRRQALDAHEQKVTDGELDAREDTKLEGRLRELFALRAGLGEDRELESEVLELVMGELRVSRRRVRRARLEEHQREVAQLERRIAKLSMLLGESEEALRRVKAAKAIDPGVSSIYDSVQGLDEGDDSFEQKSTLMKSIFEANMALRAS